MDKTLTENSKNIILSKRDYFELLNIYQKLEQILLLPKKEKITPSLKTLYGIWKGAKIEEEDIQNAKKSLFKTSL